MPTGNSGLLEGLRKIGPRLRDLVIEGGLPGAPYGYRLRGATPAGPPTSGTWKTGDLVPDRNGTFWFCYAGGTPGTWIPAGDRPWQFRPETYGAKRNGTIITDAVMTSGSPTLSSASGLFTPANANGSHYLVSTATGSYTHLHATGTFVSNTSVTLSANATANTGGTPGAICYWGTDDTAAIQAAINAAVAYATANNGYAEVVFSDGIYIIAGAFQVGGSTLGNFQIGLPIIVPGSAQQVIVALRGAMETTPLIHWLQTAPQASGTVLASVRTDGTNNGTYGPASVIGGPINGYGGEPGTFSNALIKIRGISTLVPYNASMSGVDLFGMLEADVDTYTSMTAAVVPASSAPVPTLSSAANISNQYTFGLRMPDTGNQVICRVAQFSTEGMCYGICPSEWTYGEDIHCMYSIIGVAPWAGGVTMVHATTLLHVQVENCTNAVGPNGSGTMRIDINDLETESVSASALIYDPSSQMQGTFIMRPQGAAGTYQSNGWLSGGSGGQLLRLINNMTTPGPISSPHAVSSSGSPWFNGYTRDAWVTLSATTITAVTITGPNGVTVAQNGLAGSPGTYTLLLPSGGSYTATYTGTLTHTITLI